MPIQILGLRSFTNNHGEEKKYDAFHEKMWRAESVPILFDTIDTVLSEIPSEEQWNLFYTLANCGDAKREFKSQDVLAFDIDSIDTLRIDEYILPVCATLQVRPEDVAIVASGNGLHFIVGLKKVIREAKFFKECKHHYKAVCERIEKALKEKTLPGKPDPAVFDARRILRLPGTENRKADRPSTRARILRHSIIPLDFDLTALSGIPSVSGADQISKDFFKRYPRVDASAVLDGCEFLKWTKANQAKVNEPQWYAMLSILGRMENGEALANEYSEKHPAWTPEATAQKLEQSLQASGPRTCDNIGQIWRGCNKCPHFNKVKSPIMIVGEGHIATENTGFHNVFFNANGEVVKTVPNYYDLKAFFERLHPYKGLGESRMAQVWNGKFYEYMANVFIEEFAQENFNPPATTNKVREFRELVCRTNLEPVEWYERSTSGKINMLNGVYDIETGDIQPHTSALGFRQVLPYGYEPDAKCTMFLNVLRRITSGDEAILNVIQEYFGYCLAGDEPWTHKALLMVGGGANGKSTVVNVLKAAAGKGNYASLNFDELAKSEYNRALLDRKLFNVSEETPTKSMMDNSFFKTLVSGGEIQARSPYKEPFFYRNRAKLVFLCNELPTTHDNSFGFYRRLIIIPFLETFTEDSDGFDPRIEEKLLKELPGIFNWLIEGYRRLQRQGGFTKCAATKEALEEYRDDMDSLRMWFKEKIIFTNLVEDFSAIDDLYNAYKVYSESSGQRPLNKPTFCRRLRGLFPKYDKLREVRSINNVSIRGLVGVQFLSGSGVATNVVKLSDHR